MLVEFNGPAEIPNAYEAALPANPTENDLVVIRNAIGASAIGSLMKLDGFDPYDINSITHRFQEIIYNAVPELEHAESLIADWARTNPLPSPLTVCPRMEARANIRHRGMRAHVDTWSPANPILNEMCHGLNFAYGPFAISAGLQGVRQFNASRFPRRLTAEELLTGWSYDLEAFNLANLQRPDKKLIDPQASAQQGPGDLILIPGTPQPSLHSVEVGENTSAVTSSYIVTQGEGVGFDDMRLFEVAKRCLSQRVRILR